MNGIKEYRRKMFPNLVEMKEKIERFKEPKKSRRPPQKQSSPKRQSQTNPKKEDYDVSKKKRTEVRKAKPQSRPPSKPIQVDTLGQIPREIKQTLLDRLRMRQSIYEQETEEATGEEDTEELRKEIEWLRKRQKGGASGVK